MWSCDSITNYTGNCYYHDQANFMIYVGPFCPSNTQSCFLSDYYDNQGTSPCQASQGRRLLSQYLEEKYCTGFSFTEHLNCQKYCGWVNKEWECEFQKWQADQNQDQSKLKGNLNCTIDSQCASSKCDCVINPENNYGSCASSAFDSVTEDFFEYVCGDDDDSFEGKNKRQEQSCQYYIMLKLQHLIKSIDKYGNQLPCIKKFDDYGWILNVEEDDDGGSSHWLAWFIPVVSIGTCCIFVIIIIVYKQSKKKQNQGSEVIINQDTNEQSHQAQYPSKHGGQKPKTQKQNPVPMQEASDDSNRPLLQQKAGGKQEKQGPPPQYGSDMSGQTQMPTQQSQQPGQYQKL